MKLGSTAVKDVVQASAAFVISCDERPLNLTQTQADRFREMCNALEFLQRLVETEPNTGTERPEA